MLLSLCGHELSITDSSCLAPDPGHSFQLKLADFTELSFVGVYGKNKRIAILFHFFALL